MPRAIAVSSAVYPAYGGVAVDVDDDVFTNLAENVLAESRWANKQHGISGFRQNRQDDEDSILDFIWDDPLEYEIYTKKGNLFC